jgi:hypothetical protein
MVVINDIKIVQIFLKVENSFFLWSVTKFFKKIRDEISRNLSESRNFAEFRETGKKISTSFVYLYREET